LELFNKPLLFHPVGCLYYCKCHGSSQQNLNPGSVMALTVELPVNQSIPGTVTYLKEKRKVTY